MKKQNLLLLAGAGALYYFVWRKNQLKSSGIKGIYGSNKMSLSEKIKRNPYLKISNCTDINDVYYATDCLRELDKEYGENNKT